MLRHRVILSVLLVVFSGCAQNKPTAEPVAVTIKVTAEGKPVDRVSLTLQPMVDGAQAVAEVNNGEVKAVVVPGKYTYYIDKGKSDADLAKIPEKYRLGDMERTLEITQAGSHDIQL